MRREYLIISKVCVGCVIIIFFCGFLIFYWTALQCTWPTLVADTLPNDKILKAFIFADTQLLGARESHWFSKWRRELQMSQAFHAIVNVHKPDVIFAIGNLINEGAWSTDDQFNFYVQRFFELFSNSTHNMYVAAGTHDIGFHNGLEPKIVERFNKLMSADDVQHLYLKGSNVILLNSMALDGVSCRLCKYVRHKLQQISEKLKCTGNVSDKNCCNRPIIIQHLSLFRKTDDECEGPDIAPFPERLYPHIPDISSLSKESTDYLVTTLKPRVVFGARSYGCLNERSYKKDNNTLDVVDITAPSFDWRQRHDPKYMLVSITPTEVAARVCDLPTEYNIVMAGVILYLITIIIAAYEEITAIIFPVFRI